MPVYLDHNATTRTDPRVVDAVLPYLQGPYGNPSSLHRYGRMARDAVEQARAQVAKLVNAQPHEILWTSGGTESNNLALKGVLGLSRWNRVLYGATEHPAVMECAESFGAQGWHVQPIEVDPLGIVKWPELETEFVEKDDIEFVSLMRANNETGVIQDVARAAAMAHANGALMHVDAVQAVGKIAVDFAALDCDLMSFSSHKLYGPKGIGALVVKSGTELHPLHHGGPQERGLRGGTENVAAIAGFGCAAELAAAELAQRATHARALRDALELGLHAIRGVSIFGEGAERLPNTTQFALAGYDGEALLMQLDRKGFAVSSGSACASGSHEPSHVLLAMGYSREVALGAIRVSVGKDNQAAEIGQFLEVLRALAP